MLKGPKGRELKNIWLKISYPLQESLRSPLFVNFVGPPKFPGYQNFEKQILAQLSLILQNLLPAKFLKWLPGFWKSAPGVTESGLKLCQKVPASIQTHTVSSGASLLNVYIVRKAGIECPVSRSPLQFVPSGTNQFSDHHCESVSSGANQLSGI